MLGSGPNTTHIQGYMAQVEAQLARNAARESSKASDKARRNLEQLYMVVHAMWELLSERVGLTDADLEAKIQEIDLRDGRLDGQDATETTTQTCQKCSRPVAPGQHHCPWCGEPMDNGAFNHAR